MQSEKVQPTPFRTPIHLGILLKVNKMELTCERLKEILEYDPVTGFFKWKEKLHRKTKIGNIAGCIRPDGYVRIGINHKKYAAQNLALLYMKGYWPAKIVDHINNNPSDNRWSNLREATISQNNANSRIRSDNTSGFKGVIKINRKWQARIRIKSKLTSLGVFETAEEAHFAYKIKANEVFGAFANEGGC